MTLFGNALESYTTSKRRIAVTLKNFKVSGLFRSITVESGLTKRGKLQETSFTCNKQQCHTLHRNVWQNVSDITYGCRSARVV